MKLDHTHPFAESSERSGNLTVSQREIDEALELICNDPDVMDLTQKPLDLAITIANKAKRYILANSAENDRDDLEQEFTEERILAMRNQALALIFDKSPDSEPSADS